MNELKMKLTETENREYKQQITKDIERSVIGFLNSDAGGEICIGIDADGTVYGVKNYDEESRKLSDMIRNNISPSALGLYSITPKMRNDRPYLHVTIAVGPERPYYLNEFGMIPRGCFIRVGTHSIQMTERMIEDLYKKRSLCTLKNTVSPSQKLTFAQLKIYYDEMGFSTDNDNFLENLDLYTDDGKFNFLAYLMADRNNISIKVARYADTNKIRILQKTECGNCSLIRAAHSMLTTLDLYNETAVEITYPERVDTNLVDTEALRECVLNSIIHNDYITGGCPVVEFYPDRVEITSSGGLPSGLTIEGFFDGVSRPRNRELMRIFSDMKLCEHLGSGMKRIMRTYSPEDFKITDGYIRASFKYNEHALEVMNKQKSSEKSSEKLSAIKERILELISEDNVISADAMATLIGISSRAVEKNIKQLRDAGILERINGDRGGHWKIDPEKRS